MKREQIEKAIDVAEKTGEKYEWTTILRNIDKLKEEMKNFSLKILFVGEFSAGKSALINTILGKDVLEEGQRPETSIAGELVYDVQEYVEGVAKDGTVRMGLEQAALDAMEAYDYLIWHLDSPALKQLKGCTIVDMPGFNSGIKEHNKAILQYAGKGNAYVLVIDCEGGTIKQNMVSFIDEVKNYDENMAIVVMKSDLKLPKDMEEIVYYVNKDAEMMFGNGVPVITASKYDEDTPEKMLGILNGFDESAIFCQKFAPMAQDVLSKCLDALKTYQRSLGLDIILADV